jgi:hypothetical protein
MLSCFLEGFNLWYTIDGSLFLILGVTLFSSSKVAVLDNFRNLKRICIHSYYHNLLSKSNGSAVRRTFEKGIARHIDQVPVAECQGTFVPGKAEQVITCWAAMAIKALGTT